LPAKQLPGLYLSDLTQKGGNNAVWYNGDEAVIECFYAAKLTMISCIRSLGCYKADRRKSKRPHPWAHALSFFPCSTSYKQHIQIISMVFATDTTPPCVPANADQEARLVAFVVPDLPDIVKDFYQP